VSAAVTQRSTAGDVVAISNLAVALAIDGGGPVTQCKDVEIDAPGPIQGSSSTFSVFFLNVPTQCGNVNNVPGNRLTPRRVVVRFRDRRRWPINVERRRSFWSVYTEKAAMMTRRTA